MGTPNDVCTCCTVADLIMYLYAPSLFASRIGGGVKGAWDRRLIRSRCLSSDSTEQGTTTKTFVPVDQEESYSQSIKSVNHVCLNPILSAARTTGKGERSSCFPPLEGLSSRTRRCRVG
jgi:hypothetical protein